MKCPRCGYNTFGNSDSCKKCGESLKSVVLNPRRQKTVGNKGNLSEDPDNIPLFKDNEPLLLNSEIGDFSFHGSSSVPTRQQKADVNEISESYIELASFKRRLFAFFFDVTVILLIPLPTFIIGLQAAGIDPLESAMKLYYILIPVYAVLCLLASTYLIFLHAYSGKSIGKLLFGIRVIKDNCGRIYFNDSFVRWIGYYLSAIPLFYGYISAFFDYNLQTWHDKIAQTYVVKDG